MKNIRAKEILFIGVLVSVIAGISHFVITNPLGPSRLLYFLQAPFIQMTVTCNSDAPDWMSDILRYTTLHMGAPASQLAYVSQNGHLSHCEVGWRDGVFGDHRVSRDDRFRYASTTKTVTAAAILELVNRGELSLQDEIVELLQIEGGFKDPRVREITIEDLLSHRAGWDRVRTQDVMFAMNSKPWCPGDPGRLKDTVLLYNPGETESYSNMGYCLLGLAIEKVTARPFREFMAERFGFEAAGLKFVDGPFLADEVQYDFRNEEFFSESYHKYFDFEALSSSAGLSGSASELALFLKKSLERDGTTILDGAAEIGCDFGKVNSCYGYGVYRYQARSDSVPMFVHGGKLPGVTSSIFIEPEGGVLVWLGAGSPMQGKGVLSEFYGFIDRKLGEKKGSR